MIFIQSIGQQPECESKIKILELKNDSLQGRIKSHYEIELDQLKKKTDKFETNLNSLKEENKALIKSNKQLSDDLSNCKNKSQELEKSKLNFEKDNLTKQLDTLKQKNESLKGEIKDLNAAISNEKNKCASIVTSKLDSLKKSYATEKLNFYLDNKFDFLINNCTLTSIMNDERFTSQNKLAQQKLADLKMVFNSMELTKEKYNPQKINTSIANLKLIEQDSELIKKQISELNQYQYYHDELKNVIHSIISLDSEGEFNNSEMGNKRKQAQISLILYNYYSEYSNLTKYPYLQSIFQEISTKKKLDINTPLNYLLNKF